jgi:hypothetical protein
VIEVFRALLQRLQDNNDFKLYHHHFLLYSLQFLTLAHYFVMVSWLTYSLTLKMEATYSSESLVGFQHLHGVLSQETEIFVPSVTVLARASSSLTASGRKCGEKGAGRDAKKV